MSPTPRPITAQDWPAIVALEAQTYAADGLSEQPEALISRHGRDTSFVLTAGETIAGYLLALPYPRLHYPDLTRADTRSFVSTNLHLHDLVIAPGYRRMGMGGRLLGHFTTEARRQAYEMVSLVAVGDGARFWRAHGFSPCPEIVLPAGYGPGATYMSQRL